MIAVIMRCFRHGLGVVTLALAVAPASMPTFFGVDLRREDFVAGNDRHDVHRYFASRDNATVFKVHCVLTRTITAAKKQASR